MLATLAHAAKADVVQLESEVAALELQCKALGASGASAGSAASTGTETGQRVIKVQLVSDL